MPLTWVHTLLAAVPLQLNAKILLLQQHHLPPTVAWCVPNLALTSLPQYAQVSLLCPTVWTQIRPPPHANKCKATHLDTIACSGLTVGKCYKTAPGPSARAPLYCESTLSCERMGYSDLNRNG